MNAGEHAEAAILVAGGAHRDPRRDVVFQLDDGPLSGSNIGRESNKQIAGDALQVSARPVLGIDNTIASPHSYPHSRL